MSDTAMVTDDDVTIIVPPNIHIGILASAQPEKPSFVVIGFTKSKAFMFGDTTDKTREMAIRILQCADESDRENGIFSPKKTENTIRKYLAEMKAQL
jgi:hypothetical protein